MRWRGNALLLILLAISVPACGYRLQGSENLPVFMAVTYIETANPYSDLSLSLERSLRASGVQPRRVADGATAVLRLNRDEYGQRLLSVSATNVPQEFEVYYTVAYQVIVDGKVLLEVESRTLTNNYTFDPTDVLAKSREETLLRKALADDLVKLILRRITALEAPGE